MVRGQPQPLGREHPSRSVAEAAWDVCKLRLGLELGKSLQQMQAFALHRPPSFYAQHPTWSCLATLPPLEVASLLAGGVAADFLQAPDAIPRHTRAGRAASEPVGATHPGNPPQQQQHQQGRQERRQPASVQRRRSAEPRHWLEWPSGSGQWVHALTLRNLSSRRLYLPGDLS
jgi:hypothetical protein